MGDVLSIKSHATVATCIVLHTRSVYMKKHLKKDHVSLNSSIGWATNVVEAKKHMATMIYGRLELNPKRNNLIYITSLSFLKASHNLLPIYVLSSRAEFSAISQPKNTIMR